MNTSTRSRLLLATSALGFTFAGPANAQTAPAAADTRASTQEAVEAPPNPRAVGTGTTPASDQEIVVTGSRTVSNGFAAPTPVSVISASQLLNAQPQTLSQGLATLPQFRNSASPQSYGTGTSPGSTLGASYVNLRGLGAQRTLILLDGHRVTPSSFLGSADIGILPEALISRVDVVTGGASAAYGSDAISGVVNFGLNTKFTGVSGSAQGGISQRNDGQNYKVTAALGLKFAGDRGHLLVSGEMYDNKGVPDYYGRDWALRGYAAIAVPGVTLANSSPTNPRTVIVPNVTFAAGTYGGLITNSVLRLTQFLPGGVPAPFALGAFATGATMQGGSGIDAYRDIGLQPQQRRKNLFGRVDFALTDHVSVYAQAVYGENKVIFVSGPGAAVASSSFTIFRDNAFLPSATRDAMTTRNIASFTLGRVNRDFSFVTYDSLNRTFEGNLGVKGELAPGWKFDAYYSHGQNTNTSNINNQQILPNLYRAADAVVNPANGQIVCRSTLTSPGNGCVPINLFGEGSPSSAAAAYVTGNAVARQIFKQDYLGFSINGNLLRLPGGPLAIAAGGEYRSESARQTSDALSSTVITAASVADVRGFPAVLVNRVGVFERQNPPAFSGSTHVAEGFVEVNAPLVRGATLLRAFDLNGAVRYANYKNSGGVTTWKAGAIWEPVSGLRLRVTKSRDIRAASLFEQYLPLSAGAVGGPITDPFNGGASVPSINVNVAGNPNLKPEKADSLSYGAVLRPRLIPGFGLSVDYWRVNVKNAISQLFQSTPATNAQLLINQCFAGNAALCGAINRFNGTITSVNNNYFNISQLKASGVDIEGNYRVPLTSLFRASGTTLDLRAVASYLHELSSRLPGGVTIDRAGDNGQSAAGSPHWTGTATADLNHGPLELFVQARYIGSGNIDNTLGAADININHVPAVVYGDMTFKIRFSRVPAAGEFFLTVNNVFDKDPPIDPRFVNYGTVGTNRNLYDVVGRQFTAGVRLKI